MQTMHPILAEAVRRARWLVVPEPPAPEPPPIDDRPPWTEPHLDLLLDLSAQDSLAACKDTIVTSLILPRLLHEVVAKHGLAIGTVKSKRRSDQVAYARHEYYYRAMMETTKNLTQIGEVLGADHTTVIYGVGSHCQRVGVPVPRGSVAVTRKMQRHPRLGRRGETWRNAVAARSKKCAARRAEIQRAGQEKIR